MNDIYLVNDTYNSDKNFISNIFNFKLYDKNEVDCFCYVLEPSLGMYDLFTIDGISDEIIDKINNEKNFYLLFNSMGESNIKDQIPFIHSKLDDNKISKEKVIFLISRNMSLLDDEVKFVNSDFLLYFVGCHLVGESNKFYNNLDFLNEKRHKRFLSFNRRLNNCWHRVLLLILSSKHKLFKNNYITYNLDPEFDLELPPLDELINLTDQPKGSYNLISQKELHTEMDKLVKNKKNIYETFSGNMWNDRCADYTIIEEVVNIYKSSYISLVTETFFYEDEYIVTEKAYQPMAYFHPFIILGSPYTLKHLRSMGFKTFGDFWDESYDEELDNDKRFEKIFNLILYFNKIPIEELHDLYVEMIPILKYNYKLLLSYGTTVNLSGSLKRSILDVIE